MKNTYKLTIFLLAVGVISAITFFSINKDASATNSDQMLKDSVVEGLNEIYFTQHALPNEINNSVDSLSAFTTNRSGVQITVATKQRLAALENGFRSNNQNGLSSTDLGNLLSETIKQRMLSWTSQDVAYAVENFRGFNHPDLPEPFKKGRDKVNLRADGVGSSFTPSQLTTYINGIKTNQGILSQKYYGFMQRQVVQDTEECYSLLSDVMPSRFSSSTPSISPVDALLISYSVIADDNLAYSVSNLNGKMNSLAQWSAQDYGSFPSPSGHKAYGPNGYIFSSPIDILLDDQGINILLDKYEAGRTQ